MAMDVCAVTKALIATGEKSAAIARAIRSEKELLSLLIEEKPGKQKNNRFVKDFKTLADVLVQETVRHDLSVQFPELSENFHGEESNKFTNTVGESITVEVKSSREETCALLETVLNGHRHAAELLAEVVHSSVGQGPELSIKPGDHALPYNSVGIWIDPIDSTAQYINGETGVINSEGLAEQGLQSVLVLIGLYDLHTGQPLIGVINQPFSKYYADTDRWEGHCVWGVSIGDLRVNSMNLQTPSQKASDTSIVVLSSSEDTTIKDCLSQMSRVTYASGAGYKIMVTVLGLVDAYVITKSSTFKWDVCGPHAIILSRGGGIVSFSGSLKLYKEKQGQISQSDLTSLQVKYSAPDSESCEGADLWCNQGGIIVYSDTQFLIKLLQKFSTTVTLDA